MSRTERPIPLACLLACYPPSQAAVQRRCGRCPEETLVWVSMDVLAEVDAGKLEPMCLPCMDALFRADPEAELVLTRAQTDTMTKLGLLGWADQFTTAVNRRERRVTGEWVAPARGE